MMTKELSFSTIAYSNHFLKVIYKPNQRVDLKAMKELVQECSAIVKDEPFVCLSHVTPGGEVTKDARNYLANYKGVDFRASAVVASTSAVRVFVNFFIKFSNPFFPVKMFGTPGEAMEWLKPFLLKCREQGGE